MIMRGIEHRKGVCRIVMQRGLWELKGINTKLSEKTRVNYICDIELTMSNGFAYYTFEQDVVVLSVYTVRGSNSVNSYGRAIGYRKWELCNLNGFSGTIYIDIVFMYR